MGPRGWDRVWRGQGLCGAQGWGRRDGVEGKGRQEGGRDGMGGEGRGGGRRVGAREGWEGRGRREDGGREAGGGRGREVHHLPCVTRCFRVPHRGLRVCPNAFRLKHNQQQAAHSHIPANPCEHFGVQTCMYPPLKAIYGGKPWTVPSPQLSFLVSSFLCNCSP